MEGAHGLRAAGVELGRLAEMILGPEPRIRMLSRLVRLGIYRSGRASAGTGPSAQVSRRAGAECRTGCRSGREYRMGGVEGKGQRYAADAVSAMSQAATLK